MTYSYPISLRSHERGCEVCSSPLHSDLRCLPFLPSPSERGAFIRSSSVFSTGSQLTRTLPPLVSDPPDVSSLPLLGHSLLSCFRTALSAIFSISSREGGSNVMEFLSRSLCGSRVICKFHEPSRHSLPLVIEKFIWIEVGCLLMAG